MVILGHSVIIDGSLYERVLGYPSIDFIFLCTKKKTYIEAVRRRINFEEKIGIFAKFRKILICGLRHIEINNAYRGAQKIAHRIKVRRITARDSDAESVAGH